MEKKPVLVGGPCKVELETMCSIGPGITIPCDLLNHETFGKRDSPDSKD